MPFINKSETTQREVKALTIVGQNHLKRIDAVTYKVKSQTHDEWYSVRYVNETSGWICTCKDHIFRKLDCKHILSCLISKQLRNKIVNHSDIPQIENQDEIICKCGSLNVKKDGIRKNKSGNIQKYQCKECGKKWSDNLGFEANRVNSKIITLALDLYFKGVSLRKVKDHIMTFHGVKVSHVAILGWIRKFAEVVTPYVDQFIPETSGVYHVDEMMIHVRREKMEKGHYQWLWNVMDNTTRFWITSKVSQRREVADARATFQDAKSKSPRPKAVIHDGLQSYNEAFNREYYSKKDLHIQNIRSISVRKKGLNQKVERLNGTMRDREKVMRGMNHKESSQKLIEAYRVYYNFVREHSSIKQTPAENAGIDLKLDNNKIMNLIKQSSKN